MKCLKVNDNMLIISKTNEEMDFDIYITKKDSSFLIEFYNYGNEPITIEHGDSLFHSFYKFFKKLPERDGFISLFSEDYTYITYADFIDVECDLYSIAFDVLPDYDSYYINDGRFANIDSDEYITLFKNLFKDLLNQSVEVTNEDYIINKESPLLDAVEEISGIRSIAREKRRKAIQALTTDVLVRGLKLK